MASAKNIKPSKKEEVQLDLIYSDETQFKYWESHLFNDVYLRKDLPVKHKDVWDFEENLGFQNFMNTLRNLAAEYDGQEEEFSSWSEEETIHNWIKHVLDALGWADNSTGIKDPYLYQTSLRYEDKTYRTDLLIVDMPKEKQYITKAKGDDKLVQAREAVLIPVEAKYWNRLEQYRQGQGEEKKRVDAQGDDTSKTMTPNEQTIKYMEILKKDWGVLTDGARWRLFNREISSEDTQRYYEFNLESLIESLLTEETEHDRQEVMEAAKYFYFFFSKSAIFPDDESEQPLVDEVLSFSKKYVNKVEEDLKDRFVKAMNFACNGLFRSFKTNKNKVDLKKIRNLSESTLFNVLFIKSLESRNVLPMNSDGYRKLSLSSIIDKIERFDPDKDDEINIRNLERTFKKSNGSSFKYKDSGTEIHDKIVRLTKIIHDGGSKKDDFGFEIAGFKESIFSKEEWFTFGKNKIENKYWVNILFQIGYAESDTRTRKYQQIPYSFFSPRQLGSIYESFLEFKLENADDDMVFEEKQWKAADLNSRKYKNVDLPKVKKGELFFTPNNEERKATGSYYTPDYVVKKMVSDALKPLLKKKTSKEILKVSVCDPAMGSGHFLAGSLNFITKYYLEALYKEAKGDLSITLPEAKRIVLDACIYGVDVNPRAVKLAKMSLWLESAFINSKLERLDDQLKAGDTLLEGNWTNLFPKVFPKGFDLIIGNPPYVSFYSKQSQKDNYEKELDEYKKRFKLIVPHRINTVVLFIEKTISELVSKDGRVTYLIDQNFFEAPFQPIRQYLASECAMEISYGINAFEGVGSSQLILTLERPPKNHTKVKDDMYGEFRDISTLELVKERVTFKEESEALRKVISKLGIPLNNEFLAQYGAEIGGKKKSYPYFVFSEDNKKKDFLKLLKLSRKDFYPYCAIKTEGYVNYDPKLAIEIRGKYKKLNVALRDRELWNRPKIIMRQSAKNNCGSYSAGGVISLLNTFVITHVNDNSDDLMYLLGLINSKVFSYYFIKEGVNRTGEGKQPQIRSSDLNKIMLPSVNKVLKEKIIQMVSMCLRGEDGDGVDELVYQIFDLNKKEIDEISSFVENYKDKKAS